jgi:murein DD-endopeptidase MepM/ murein hydrolase activator NlpD
MIPSRRRALLAATVAVALLMPSTALASTTGGVAAPAPGAPPTGGTRAGDPAVVRAPRPPKPRKRKRRRPISVVSAGHVFPLAGPFTWPGPGGRFGAQRSGHTHQGFDLLAAEGVPVVAPYAGTVSSVAYQARGAGCYVVLHADFDYAFMHLAAGSTVVRVGQRVAAGDRIGDVGSTGAAEGSHLHFEIWQGLWQQGGGPIDPEPFLRAWAPR